MPRQIPMKDRKTVKTTQRSSPQPADPKTSSSTVSPTAEQRRAMIAETAYSLAQSRGFVPGYEVEDWLAAEATVAQELTRGR